MLKHGVLHPPPLRIHPTYTTPMSPPMLWMNSKHCTKLWETLCLLIIVNLSSALWCFTRLVIEIYLVQNYFFALKSIFGAIIFKENSDKTYKLIEIDVKHKPFIEWFSSICLRNYRYTYSNKIKVSSVLFQHKYKQEYLFSRKLYLFFRFSEFHWLFSNFFTQSDVLIGYMNFLKKSI